MMQISDYKTTDLSALPEPLRHRTQMTRIGRIFTDIFNPCVSVLSVRSVFHPEYNEPQISRNFGLRSVGVCEAYPSFDKTFIKFFDKPFLKVYADERRYIHVAGFDKTTHRKGHKERKVAQPEPLCPLCSLWLNAFFAPAHEPRAAAACACRSSAVEPLGGMRMDGHRVTEISEILEEGEW